MNVLPDGTPTPDGSPTDHRTFTLLEWNAGIGNLERLVGALWSEKPSITVSEYADQTRRMPDSSPFPGLWSTDHTPYLREIMDNMSVRSPIQRQVIAKGAQLGFTAASENVIAYWMDLLPTSVMYVSATDDLLRIWSETRLDPMIDSCGMRDKISSAAPGKSNKRSGDKTLFKQFVGGSLALVSAQSPGKLRSQSIRLLVRDEIDGAPSHLKTGEGNWLQVSFARTNAYGRRRKVMDFSTPTTVDESIVWPEYESGDQRKYAVPCPHCHRMQFLVWESEDEEGPGIKWELDKDNPKRVASVWYQCEFCKGAIENQHKTRMLELGEWIPTSVSSSDTLRSYHMSALYSPVGMLSWEDMVGEYLKAQTIPDGMRSFVQLNLGEAYVESGKRPAIEKLYGLRTNYTSGNIPSDDILFLTAAADVQRGSKRGDTNPARIELEVCGHGAGYRSWSIAYFKFIGDIDDPYSGAWAALDEFAREGGLKFIRADGVKFQPSVTFFDMGDHESANAAYAFAGGWSNAYACKGSRPLKEKDGEKPDEATDRELVRYRKTKGAEGAPLIVISSRWYKNIIYKNLEIPYRHTGKQLPGFCAFPRDYPDAYFQMLSAEEKRADGSFYHPKNRPNEALDIRTYNLAACDFYIDTWIEIIRAHYKKTLGHTDKQLQAIRSPTALEWIAKQVKKRKAKGV